MSTEQSNQLVQQPLVTSRTLIVSIVYLSFFLDNMLLTVVVPIIPDYLYTIDSSKTWENTDAKGKDTPTSITDRSVLEQLVDENVPVSVLLSSKALVQLGMNPLVGLLTKQCGYHLPLFVGSINLLVAALLFAFGESYGALFIARSLQGVASACIGVSGMCLVAEHFTTETSRSKVMGFVLGSVALGVLLGYPFGGFVYDFFGKMAAFLSIALLVLVDLGLQLSYLNLRDVYEKSMPSASWRHLLSDGFVLLTAGAIWLSSSAMAVLEPCLPLWLMTNIKPQKWQLGTVFIPDSLGYLIGTNFFGIVALRLGRWRVAVAAMILVGVSTFLVPTAAGMSGLVLPHFGLGLGIGVVDSALVPLLASLVDSRHGAHYGCVYALQQMAVSLAYSLGPMIGGELVQLIGFPWLLRCIGIVNIMYCPLLVLLGRETADTNQNTTLIAANGHQVKYKSNEELQRTCSTYKKFINSEDSD